MTGGWVSSCRAAAQRLEGTRTPMAADGHHPGQHVAAHADPQGQGNLRLDARGRLRGKGADEHRGALRFRATRDNRGNDTTCPALALTMEKISTFTLNTFTLTPVLRGAQHVHRHVLRQVLHVRLSRVT